jgi:ketosteroid isomerase-like protein
MRIRLTVSAVLVVAITGSAQEPALPALQAMVEAERAFAQAATQKGIRDSFLDYFAADSIAFNPAPISAPDRLRQRPARAFSEAELRWEPRMGDVAASGELGWLTGPSTFTDHTVADARPQPGNYLSVWRRQPDGEWRVFIDQGSQPPEPVGFAPGFTRFTFPSRYTGGETGARASASLQAADGALNAALGGRGGAAYGDVTTETSRLHRSGFMPSIGRVAIEKWMKEHASTMTATTGAAQSALSGDLGYTYGTFAVTAPAPKSGAYVRVWQRDGSGKWLVVVDVTQ